MMLDDKQKDALRQWYAQEKILQEAQYEIENEDWEGLEEFIQMRALMPLSRHSVLPDFMKTPDGQPVIPKNCNPREDLEEWRDAVEVGWEVVEDKLGLKLDQVHLNIKDQQEESWDSFMKSIEKRKRERGLE